MPAWVSYCMYQVPIMTMAYLPDRKSLLASGYCCTPSAPVSMIPSLNISFQMVSALTMTGLVHGTWPWIALVHTPGWMLSEMACRVSSLNAVWPTPWTKQPTPCALKAAQSLTHCASVVGGVRWYLLNRFSLIQTVPAIHRADRDGRQLAVDHQAGRRRSGRAWTSSRCRAPCSTAGSRLTASGP